MAEKLEDLNLPNTIVTRLIKDALPDNVNVSKEARMAVAKAASVFVLYLTNSSNVVAMAANRKTINANDVLQGLKETDFVDFIPPLQEALEGFKKSQREKKDAASAKKKKDKEDGDKPEEMEVEENEPAENSEVEN